MGLLDLVKGLLGLGRKRRDVAGLGGEDDLDLVDESVDLSGGPLKPGGRRRALRDPRLLPKKKSVRSLLGLKKKRVFSADEARRLFSPTLRTLDRGVRDLLPDEEQLSRLGLPPWKTEADVAAALGVPLKQLRHYATHRERERFRHYVTFTKPKRSGGTRLIMAPKRRLKALLRKVLELLVSRLPVAEQAHGFRRGRSVRTGAEPHVGRRVVLHLDLKDFFPSVHVGRVRGLLVSYGYGWSVAATLAALMTEAERQPVDIEGTVYFVPVGSRHCVQGAPTSPGLCNALVQKLDHRLSGLAKKLGFAYTRYADDLTFSGDAVERVGALRRAATAIVEAEGFTVNAAKTRIMRAGRNQRVTGVTVNQVLGLSRRERRKLRAEAHQLRLARAAGKEDQERVTRFLGKVAWVAMLNAGQAEKLRRTLEPARPLPPLAP